MKKTLALVLSLMLILTATAAMAETFGLGSVTGLGHATKDATAEADGVLQVEVTYCAVILDDEGKIKSVQYDCAQNSFPFTAEGKVNVAADAQFPTKLEKLEAYGMKVASPIGKEWYEQIGDLEQWLVGKTAEEFKAAVEAGDEELKAVASITLTDFVESLEKAVANAK